MLTDLAAKGEVSRSPLPVVPRFPEAVWTTQFRSMWPRQLMSQELCVYGSSTICVNKSTRKESNYRNGKRERYGGCGGEGFGTWRIDDLWEEPYIR